MKSTKKGVKQKSIDVEEKFGKRFDNNLSIRKKKREKKLGIKRTIDTKLYSNLDLIDTSFYKNLKNNELSAAKVAFKHASNLSNPDEVMLGLQQLRFLIRWQDRDHDHFKVLSTLPKKETCQLLCTLLKTKDPKLQKHVFEASSLLTDLITTTKSTDNEELLWDKALSQTDLISKVVVTHLMHNENKEIQKQMMFIISNFISAAGNDVIIKTLHPTLITKIQQHKCNDDMFSLCIWYVYCVVAQPDSSIDWESYVKPFWSFVALALNNSVDNICIIDALCIWLRAYNTHETYFEKLASEIKLERLCSFLEHSNNDIVNTAVSIICRLENEKLLQKILPMFQKHFYSFLTKPEVRLDVLFLICKMSKQNYKFVLEFCIPNNYIEQVAKTLPFSNSPLMIDYEIKFLYNAVAFCIEQKLNDKSLFQCLFESGEMVHNLCKVLRSCTIDNNKVFVLQLLHAAMLWNDHLNPSNKRNLDLIRMFLEDNDEIIDTIQNNLLYKSENNKIIQSATELIDLFEKKRKINDDIMQMDLNSDEVNDNESENELHEEYIF